jgi:hypothetical protein
MSQVTEIRGSAPDMAGTSGTAEPPLSAAERMALYRKRKKGGLRCVWLEVRKSEIAGLVRAGLLDKNESNDLWALKAALYRHLEETLDPLPSSRTGA